MLDLIIRVADLIVWQVVTFALTAIVLLVATGIFDSVLLHYTLMALALGGGGILGGYVILRSSRYHTLPVPLAGLLTLILIWTIAHFIGASHTDPDGSGMVAAGLEFGSLPFVVVFGLAAALGGWIRARNCSV